ncbi:MAG: TatD family hydrolase [Bacteroidales bacterium]|nr:TatD family hydrolase [Bacteroidales bacterium]
MNHDAADAFVPDRGVLYSLGLHPWHLNPDTVSAQIQRCAAHGIDPQVVAIGECGLDRIKGAPLAVQLAAFESQIQLAEQLQKPLIIHAVRAYSDILSLVKRFHPARAWLLHGYTGNVRTTEQLLKHEVYFSLGEPALRRAKLCDLEAVPTERLFLETDTANVSIAEIYSRAANVLKIPVYELAAKLAGNFELLFNYTAK